MKITIIYDNTSLRKDLLADWGFSALVEAHEKRILFDTGANGSILLANMGTLQIGPETIDDVFISHTDFDHIGGLPGFLDRNSRATLWLPGPSHGVTSAKKIHEVSAARTMYRGLHTTGVLDEVEQSLCVETPKGVVIITGCSHPRMELIIRAASEFGAVYGIIGGLHGHEPDSLKQFDLICATHCTMHKQNIRLLYRDKYIEGGAGKVIEV
ncbi:MAG TPA: MBL fold metallo-hydrolase [Spirochaetota bacterium]|nr:MBL fold metallo-hydrolase [Spirochaetota bacterium]HPR48847.1 MBL fold metallo-hydrolase [Spirochaetota bacterium]